MNRAEHRAIARRSLTADESAAVADSEINAMVNASIIDMSRELGGQMKSSELDMTTNADGTVVLPTDVVKVVRVENDSVRMGRITLDEIYDTSDTD